MPNPHFELFEIIADELSNQNSRVLTRRDLQGNDEYHSLLDDFKDATNTQTSEAAIDKSVMFMTKHFESKGSVLPFTYDRVNGRFTATDREYLAFVARIKEIRSQGKKAKDFELGVLERLSKRTMGSLHRVGHPRSRLRKQKQFKNYLRTLGFNNKVIGGKEKDGGFDILWVLPLGAVPHKPIVSVQRKNAAFDMGTADQSLGTGKRSLGCHRGLQSHVHVPCVLFNDYVASDMYPSKPLDFVPLGLSDLTCMKKAITSKAI